MRLTSRWSIQVQCIAIVIEKEDENVAGMTTCVINLPHQDDDVWRKFYARLINNISFLDIHIHKYTVVIGLEYHISVCTAKSSTCRLKNNILSAWT